ncbi:YciI family protein [Corynebacterium callunae]|uniref:YciI family protein n=1 Tax=Corynebacterium callunae TaxID=1721 RepID=UPI003981F62B
MTYFAVTYSYSPDSEAVVAARPVHREFVASLLAEGKIVGSGPFTDGEGGALIVIALPEGSTLVDAETVMNNDPFYKEGVLDNRTIQTWNPVSKIF